jgi:hypothetical protein
LGPKMAGGVSSRDRQNSGRSWRDMEGDTIFGRHFHPTHVISGIEFPRLAGRNCTVTQSLTKPPFNSRIPTASTVSSSIIKPCARWGRNLPPLLPRLPPNPQRRPPLLNWLHPNPPPFPQNLLLKISPSTFGTNICKTRPPERSSSTLLWPS